jgi:diaminohydroxyphosphoribosylaminopyrimidine deaminase / 5-amino-6-(5-phosphoribosylamino)uracil reductase
VSGDDVFMRRALELAHRGRGGTHPNPMVGAVVARDGRILGEGFHAECGGPHAEIAALEAAGTAAAGATLYVTLEPCAHHGRTPPCTDAILQAGITRVVFAAADPNRDAAGGAALLRRAGIEVEGGILQDDARTLNAAFFHVHERTGTWVSLKLAVSLDGRIAEARGMRSALTAQPALRMAHRLRAAHDAVVIGSGTAAIDDPLLTVRDAAAQRQPLRIVVDSAARLRADSALARSAAESPVLVICGDDVDDDRLRALSDAGVATLPVPRTPDGVDLGAALPALERLDVRSVLVEGGARLATSLLRDGLVNRIHLFIAPRILGPAGIAAFDSAALMDGWRCVRAETLGPDAFLTFDPPPER